MLERKRIEINLAEYFKNNLSIKFGLLLLKMNCLAGILFIQVIQEPRGLKIEDYWKKYDEIAILGAHCQIVLLDEHPIKGIITRTEYKTVGYNNSNDSERQKAAYFISNLPTEDLTEGRHSLDLGFRWIALKDDAIRVSKCFLWGNNNYFLNHFFAEEVQKGIIDRYKYNYICLVSERYNILWELFYRHQDIFKHFLPKHPDYCFDSLREVFEEIVRSSFDGQLNLNLQKRYVYKPHEIKRIFILKQKSKLSQEETEEINTLVKIHFPKNKWETIVFELAVELQEIPSIKTLLIDKVHIEQALHRLEIEKHCNPKYKNKVIPSHTWEKGKRSSGIKKGWQA